MFYFILMCVILCCVYVPAILSVDLQEDLYLQEEYQRNIKMLSSFACKLPQPRIFLLEDIVNRTDWEHKYQPQMKNIRPLYIVLHRCEFSGCCENKGARCMPKVVENVLLTFSNVSQSRSYFRLPAKNHTACSCFTADTFDSIK